MQPALQYALLRYAQELERKEVGSGLAYVKVLRDRSLAFLDAGQATTIVETSVNGEHFVQQVQVSAVDMFLATQAVIDELDDDVPGNSSMSFPTFQGGVPL